MNCTFEEIEPPQSDGKRRLRCSTCGRTVRVRSEAERTFARCKLSTDPIVVPPLPKLGLGDWIAISLERLGITKERVARLLGPVVSDCGCRARQEALNRLGARVNQWIDGWRHKFRPAGVYVSALRFAIVGRVKRRLSQCFPDS